MACGCGHLASSHRDTALRFHRATLQGPRTGAIQDDLDSMAVSYDSRNADESCASSFERVRRCCSYLYVTINPVLRVREEVKTVFAKAPNFVIFADKDAIQKILVEEDFKKAPIYETMSTDPHVTNLFSETDKVKYRQAVRTVYL